MREDALLLGFPISAGNALRSRVLGRLRLSRNEDPLIIATKIGRADSYRTPPLTDGLRLRLSYGRFLHPQIPDYSR